MQSTRWRSRLAPITTTPSPHGPAFSTPHKSINGKFRRMRIVPRRVWPCLAVPTIHCPIRIHLPPPSMNSPLPLPIVLPQTFPIRARLVVDVLNLCAFSSSITNSLHQLPSLPTSTTATTKLRAYAHATLSHPNYLHHNHHERHHQI
jgi:hypothetical protein